MKAFITAIGTVAFVLALGWAGDVDYTEQVILHMTQEEYDNAREALAREQGREPSQREIAHYYVDHLE